MYVALVAHEFVRDCEDGTLGLTLDINEARLFPDPKAADEHLSDIFGKGNLFRVLPRGLFPDTV